MGSERIAAGDRAVLASARDAIHEREPTAEIVLYGSRARGEAGPESDFDLLILLEGTVGWAREAALLRRLYELELELDTVFGVIIHSCEEWGSPLFQAMPFHQNVSREGVRL